MTQSLIEKLIEARNKITQLHIEIKQLKTALGTIAEYETNCDCWNNYTSCSWCVAVDALGERPKENN